MTPEEIKNLPTPETDGHIGFYEILRCCNSLEQQRDALMMALEPLCRPASHNDGLAIPSIKQAQDARETLASLRSMK